jgi:hypothetical protein
MGENENLKIGDTLSTITVSTGGDVQYVQAIHPLRKPVDRAIQLIFQWRNSGDSVAVQYADELERALLPYEGDTDPEQQIWLYGKPKDE